MKASWLLHKNKPSVCASTRAERVWPVAPISSWHAGQSAHSASLLSSLRKLGYCATVDNERQLSWRNKSAHSSVSCHSGGGGFDAVVRSKQVLRREAWRQLPPSVNKSRQTYLPLQVQDKYSRRRHAWRWRVRKSKRRRNQGEREKNDLGLRRNVGHWSELILTPIILLPLHSFTLLSRRVKSARGCWSSSNGSS